MTDPQSSLDRLLELANIHEILGNPKIPQWVLDEWRDLEKLNTISTTSTEKE